MEVRILGPLEVLHAGASLPLGGAKQRAVFAMLALHANRVLPMDTLIDGLWAEAAPADPANVIQVYVSRFRKLLSRTTAEDAEEGRISSRRPGYVLNISPDHVDLHRFERLIRVGNQAMPRFPDQAATALGEALSLWRGRPLAEFTEEPFAQSEGPRLEEQWLSALTMRIEADLALGRHGQLISELESLASRFPLNEGFRRQLILSLYRSGRQADALEAYRKTRIVLADELGIEPTPGLKDLEAAVLAQDPDLAWTPREPFRTSISTAADTREHTRRPSVSNLPARNPRFTGRVALLHQLHYALKEGREVMLGQTLYGMGGVGKTQLAIEYAHRYACDYDIIWWIEAEQAVLIPDQFQDLTRQLGMAEQGVATESVQRVLAELSARTGWLLIFDNAQHPNDIAKCRPNGPGHILVTSRFPGWGALGGRIEVEVLDRSDTVAMLRDRVPDMSIELADKLAAELGDLPLAAAQAAGYIEQTGLPSTDYLRRFRSHRSALLAHGDVIGYQGSVDTTWVISLERLRATNRSAVALLELSSFLAPEPIPFSLINGHPEHLDEPLRTTIMNDPDALADVVGVIVGYSLVRRHPDGYQLHRLLQAVIKNRMPPLEKERNGATAVAVLAASYPGDPNEPARWEDYARLAPHILAIGRLGDHHQNFRHLLLRTLTYLSDTGHPETARSIAQELFDRWQRVLGPNHLDTLTAAASLTATLVWLGEHAQAKAIGKDAKRRAERELGADHPVTLRLATTTTALIWIVPDGLTPGKGSSDFPGPEPLHDDTLQRASRSLGPDHPITLGVELLSITHRLATQGDYPILQIECESALRRARHRIGPHHPTALGLAADLSIILDLTGDTARSRSLAEETARLARLQPGPDHFVTLHADSALALVLAQHGDADRARALADETLKRCRNLLGSDHIITLCAEAALAVALIRLGATAQADSLGRKVLAASRDRLGVDNPITPVVTRMLDLHRPPKLAED
jgi:DNA-binding SARP family transcriptional activator